MLSHKAHGAEWRALVEGDDVPPMPLGAWGPDATNLWAAVWCGPLRAELLPQHMTMLTAAVRIADRIATAEGVTTLVALSAELRQLSKAFGLDPLTIRAFDLDTKPAAAPAAADEVAAARRKRVDRYHL